MESRWTLGPVGPTSGPNEIGARSFRMVAGISLPLTVKLSRSRFACGNQFFRPLTRCGPIEFRSFFQARTFALAWAGLRVDWVRLRVMYGLPIGLRPWPRIPILVGVFRKGMSRVLDLLRHVPSLARLTNELSRLMNRLDQSMSWSHFDRKLSSKWGLSSSEKRRRNYDGS